MKKLSKKQWIMVGTGAIVLISAIVFRKQIKAQYDKIVAKLSSTPATK